MNSESRTSKPEMHPIQDCLEVASGVCLAVDRDFQVLALSEAARREFSVFGLESGAPLFERLPRLERLADSLLADGSVHRVELEPVPPHREGLKATTRWVGEIGGGFHWISLERTGIPERQSDWFRLAVEAAPEGMILVDAQGRILFASRETERIFGYSLVELGGMPVELLLPERYRGRHTGHRSDFLADPKARSMGSGRELFGLHKDGSEIPVEIGLNPLRRDGEIYVLASIVDITERKRMETKLIQTQKLESLGILAGGIAHDFNNILAGIQGCAELIRLGSQPEGPFQGHVENILGSVQRGAELVRQMLAYAGKSPFQLEPIDLHDLLVEMGPFLQVSIPKSAVIDLVPDARTPRIQGDPAQIRQIVLNLVTNASEALEGYPGLVSIRLGAVGDGQAEEGIQTGFELERRGYVYLEVKDNGCGLSDEVRPKMFDPFFSTKGAGRGLGLSSVMGIVRAHGGAIGMTSLPGEGTKVRVYFPALPPRPLQEPHRLPKGEPLASPLTILFVDDESVVRSSVAAMLRTLGHQVLEAEDGLEAIEVFDERAHEIGLVLLDMTMPRLDGLQTMKVLKARRPDLRVVLASGYGEPADLDLSLETGFAGFLRKPFSFRELQEAVEAAIARA